MYFSIQICWKNTVQWTTRREISKVAKDLFDKKMDIHFPDKVEQVLNKPTLSTGERKISIMVLS